MPEPDVAMQEPDDDSPCDGSPTALIDEEEVESEDDLIDLENDIA